MTFCNNPSFSLFLLFRLGSMSRQKAEHLKMEQDLMRMKAEHDSAVAEVKKVKMLQRLCFGNLYLNVYFLYKLISVGFILKLREELQRAKQTHSGEVEGMRKEVSRLTSELHQRDLTIATLSGSSSSIKQQLRGEVERAEQKAAELKVRRETICWMEMTKMKKIPTCYCRIFLFTFFSGTASA